MDKFETRDLQLAATLVALGHKPIALKDHPKKLNTKLFVFRNEANSKDIKPSQDANNYYKRVLRIEPNTLFHHNNNLREWVKSELEST